MGPGLQVLLEPGGRIVNNTSQAPSQKWQQRALLANLLTILLRLCRLPLLRLNAQYVNALLPNGIKSLYHTLSAGCVDTKLPAFRWTLNFVQWRYKLMISGVIISGQQDWKVLHLSYSAAFYRMVPHRMAEAQLKWSLLMEACEHSTSLQKSS